MGIVDTLTDCRARLSRLREVYEPPFDLGPLVIHDGAWVEGRLAANVPAYAGGAVWRLPLDSTYWLPSADDMAKIIGWDWIDHKEYVASRFDCEDFALAFKSRVNSLFLLNNVGVVVDWSAGHGYNVILLADGSVWWFEPQVDTLVDIGTSIYTLTSGCILV